MCEVKNCGGKFPIRQIVMAFLQLCKIVMAWNQITQNLTEVSASPYYAQARPKPNRQLFNLFMFIFVFFSFFDSQVSITCSHLLYLWVSELRTEAYEPQINFLSWATSATVSSYQCSKLISVGWIIWIFLKENYTTGETPSVVRYIK
jgi:hypothetical protein